MSARVSACFNAGDYSFSATISNFPESVIYAGHPPQHVYLMEEINGLQSATILGHFLSATSTNSNNTNGTNKLMVFGDMNAY